MANEVLSYEARRTDENRLARWCWTVLRVFTAIFGLCMLALTVWVVVKAVFVAGVQPAGPSTVPVSAGR